MSLDRLRHLTADGEASRWYLRKLARRDELIRVPHLINEVSESVRNINLDPIATQILVKSRLLIEASDRYERILLNLSYGDKPLYDEQQCREEDAPPPTLNRLLESIRKELNPEQAIEIHRMKRPVIQLIPCCRVERFVDWLNGVLTMPKQQEAFVNPNVRKSFVTSNSSRNIDSDKIVSWKLMVTEGAESPEVDDRWDDIELDLSRRISLFTQFYKSKMMQGMDYGGQIDLIVDSLVQNRLIDDFYSDDGTCTIINEEHLDESSVPVSNWSHYYNQVRMYHLVIDTKRESGRFRPSACILI